MVTSVDSREMNDIPHLHISPPKKWIPVNLRELWNYRELLYSFTWRDVKIRYKQTALGFLWAIIQPPAPPPTTSMMSPTDGDAGRVMVTCDALFAM